MWGPRIEGGLEPGIAEQQGDEAVIVCPFYVLVLPVLLMVGL